MELTDFLERAMVVLSALGNVFTLEWTYAVVNRLHMPIWSRLGLSALGFFGYLEVAPALVLCASVLSCLWFTISRQCFLGVLAFASAGFLCVSSTRSVFVATFSVSRATLLPLCGTACTAQWAPEGFSAVLTPLHVFSKLQRHSVSLCLGISIVGTASS